MTCLSLVRTLAAGVMCAVLSACSGMPYTPAAGTQGADSSSGITVYGVVDANVSRTR